MAEDLTPRIVFENDGARIGAGGDVKAVTTIRFMVGRFGPYEHTFDHAPSGEEKRAVMESRVRSLEGLT